MANRGSKTLVAKIKMPEPLSLKSNKPQTQHQKALDRELKKIKAALKKKDAELALKMQATEESSVALRILLEKRDADKVEFEEKILVRVKDLISPFLKNIKKTKLSRTQQTLVNRFEEGFSGIISHFTHQSVRIYEKLTPGEIQIANLIKQGKRNKELAELMHLSIRTIETYRQNIRKKLKLKNRKINLRSHLISLK